MKFTQLALITSGLLISGLISAKSYAHDLVLTVDKITQIKGSMMIALYNSNTNYKSDTNIFAGEKVSVTAKTLKVTFSNLPSGEYAIKLYQDENNNGKIDTNLIGIPTESYGFSNNGGHMGQPSFDEAKVTLNANSAINIHLH